MPAERLPMRKIKEIFRLKWGCGLSDRKISSSCNIARSTVAEYLRRAHAAGLSWPLPEEMDESRLDLSMRQDHRYGIDCRRWDGRCQSPDRGMAPTLLMDGHGCRQKLCLHMHRRWCYTSQKGGPFRGGRTGLMRRDNRMPALMDVAVDTSRAFFTECEQG
jgi:hypothetical protein